MQIVKAKAKRFLAAHAPDALVKFHRLLRRKAFERADREPSRSFLTRQYRARVGRPLELDQPLGLSEKLNRLKLDGASPLQTLCADKIKVRDYVADRVGPHILVGLILATYRLSDIRPKNIPNEFFVLKTNHDFRGVIICRNPRAFDWVAAREQLADHLAYNHWYRHREPVYKDIRPGVLVEEFLEPDAPEGLREYKVFCFGGRPEFVMVVRDHSGIRTKTIFDTAWTRLPVRRRGAPTDPSHIEPPERLTDLLDIAAQLSQPFDFCRVDLYENFGRVLFGEITFFPEGGMDVFEPNEWEQRFGDLLRLSNDRIVAQDQGMQA
ncbi:ATP-grasp fold amidoligase family protein [Nitratireductor sp. GCM10026969]|uniref:ATP-grasp fold amidoligase family protein n=1 Tax=Nitratireductor sp. GCM10026969 TaxID=3252645 RepID=UPI00361280A7